MKSSLRHGIVVLTALICTASAASAFPTWIGVYGTFVRHTDGTNPGAYMVLMNQDYVGLHANVGIQINGGAWTEYAMNYSGNVSGNSEWTYTPSTAYAAGASVKYYFHGYDNWGGVIWDTANGLNYGFTIASGGGGGGGGSGSMLWPGVGYASDPASNIHHWKEEAVFGNGYMNVMIDQNGSLYDIYYPSVGARHSVSTSNEGYRGPMEFPYCPGLDQEANGQMNMIAGQGGIGVTGTVYWLQNSDGTDYTGVSQNYVTDNNSVYSVSTLNISGYHIKVEQYDFCPAPSALPVITDGTRTNYGVYVKRYLLTNQESTSKTIDFYYDANFNINGGNDYDSMFFDTTAKAMVAYDNTYRSVPVQVSSCDPNGYTTEYSPSFAFPWEKNISLYFATAMKLVTNSVTGAGAPADGSWRDYTATDNQEGWIGKHVTIGAGQTVELDVAVAGSWDDFAGATGTYQYWGVPLLNWFYGNSMAQAESATETYWSNWLNSGVTVNFPDPNYNTLFKRSLLVSALHFDQATGSIIAGMHNGAYPFVWPRDAIYAAVTFARTGHTNEAAQVYHWLNDVAQRASDSTVGGTSYFYQKYTTDGYPVWTAAQLDESASAPWGLWYYYQITGDSAFLNKYWNLAYTSIRAASENSGINSQVISEYGLMNGENVWEDSWAPFLYSNASIVRGLQDAANIANSVGQAGWAGTFSSRAASMASAINARIDASVEPADISQLGLAVPYEVLPANDARMLKLVDVINGRQSSGGFTDNLVVQGGDDSGMLDRYQHNISGSPDVYWGGGPWTLATAWYGEYFTRLQDFYGGKSLVTTNKAMLDKIISKLGPCGLSSEQIAESVANQKYPGFWLQTAWPNVWESHSTIADAMMMFLDYKPNVADNTCYFAPKLPTGWTTMTWNNLYFRGQRLNVTITENTGNVRADVNKTTSGATGIDIYLRVPQGSSISSVQFNGGGYTLGASDYDSATGRVHVRGGLNDGANSIIINYGGGCSTPAMQWAGGTYNWPPNGQIHSTDDFWVNIQSYPIGAATYAHVVYSTDGVTWLSVDLSLNGTTGNNDAWHADLGKFGSRTAIQYAIEVRDCYGRSIWDNNNGANYRVTVN